MNIVNIKTENILSLKTILVGGVLLDVFNNEDNNLNIVVLKGKEIYNIVSLSLTSVIRKARTINQLTHPITNIFITHTLGNQILVFNIGSMEFDINIKPKEMVCNFGFDETCVLETDLINLENYRTILNNTHLSNYDKVKKDLQYGIDININTLYNTMISEIGMLSIIEGVSRLDGTTVTLIYEHITG